MNRRALVLLSLMLTTNLLLSKDYYFKQLIITPNTFTNLNDTLIQETFIMKDLVVVKDEISIQFTDDSTYTFYNMVDSTYFKKNAEELAAVSMYADSQFEEFNITPTKETGKVGNWKVEKYIGSTKVMGMEMELDLFVAKDTGLPNDILFRQQEKMSNNAPNIKKMLDKIKNTGGIVVKEVARIQGMMTSAKETIVAKEIKINKKMIERPKGFSVLQK
ncbi:MAG: hypothetical protein KAH33_07435 [Candidatus Delongbacteria bacterium]|nr:hypothetical protein [Candidatus Delongbacteria bacterium]